MYNFNLIYFLNILKSFHFNPFYFYNSILNALGKVSGDLEAILKEVTKQDPKSQQFQETIRDLAERAMEMQSQVEELYVEVKAMHRDIGTVLLDVKSSNEGIGKTMLAMVDSFTAVNNELGDLVRISKQDAEAIQALHTTIAGMRASIPESMSSLLPDMLAPINKQLNALLENCYDLPILISVWRNNATAFEAMKKGDPMLLMKFQFVLHIRFHCEYTLEPSSAAYEVKVTKDWVRFPSHNLYITLFITLVSLYIY